MTSVLVAEPGCANEGLCGRGMAARPDDLWHHELRPHTPTGTREGCVHAGRESTACGVTGGQVPDSGLT